MSDIHIESQTTVGDVHVVMLRLANRNILRVVVVGDDANAKLFDPHGNEIDRARG